MGISEVTNKDELNPVEMLESYKTLQYIAEEQKTFDRILMPLPKSAENFLANALKVSKKGTIIHFYDFLHEDDFRKAEEKVDKACKKAGLGWKKLKFTKCGQHSPRTYRVCLDFKIV
jgi:tRNA (guanine37-N1)-methyltransferase